MIGTYQICLGHYEILMIELNYVFRVDLILKNRVYPCPLRFTRDVHFSLIIFTSLLIIVRGKWSIHVLSLAGLVQSQTSFIKSKLSMAAYSIRTIWCVWLKDQVFNKCMNRDVAVLSSYCNPSYDVTWAVKLHPALVPIPKLSLSNSKSPAVASSIVKLNLWTMAARSRYISAHARLRCGQLNQQMKDINLKRPVVGENVMELTSFQGIPSFLVRREQILHRSSPGRWKLSNDLDQSALDRDTVFHRYALTE